MLLCLGVNYANTSKMTRYVVFVNTTSETFFSLDHNCEHFKVPKFSEVTFPVQFLEADKIHCDLRMEGDSCGINLVLHSKGKKILEAHPFGACLFDAKGITLSQRFAKLFIIPLNPSKLGNSIPVNK